VSELLRERVYVRECECVCTCLSNTHKVNGSNALFKLVRKGRRQHERTEAKEPVLLQG
jgi:hypothetical protein